MRKGLCWVVGCGMATLACGSDPDEKKQPEPESTAADVSIRVEPKSADVLTCDTLELAATVKGADDQSVTWSVDEGKGEVNKKGVYTAPIQVPDPNTVVVSATSNADPTRSASSHLSLFTALPSKPTLAGDTADTDMFPHQVVASGKQAYALLLSWDKSQEQYRYSLGVSASSDGGLTFSDPVVATDIPDPTVVLSCAAIAVDAGDPRTVYVSYLIDAGSFDRTSDATVPMSGKTVALSVSNDGGAHFQSYVLESHVSGWGECPDVASPAPGTVTVEAPAFRFSEPYLSTYVDTKKGSGFAKGQQDDYSYVVDESHEVTTPYNELHSDGGSFGMESPRLVTDGKGKLCVTYVGGPFGEEHVAVQCSNDSGKTFAPPVELTTAGDSEDFHHAGGAFSDNGTLAIAYWSSTPDAWTMRLALSDDGGKTFQKPSDLPRYEVPESVDLKGRPAYPSLVWQGAKLWLSYLIDDGAGAHRLIVDKSCDGGKTWSGAQLLNGPEPSIQDDYGWPGLALTDGRPTVFSPLHTDADNDSYHLFRLTP